MQQKIFKYPLAITDSQTLMLPRFAEVLTAQVQGGALCMWAVVDASESVHHERVVRIIGTGNPISPPLDNDADEYVATVQGALVWHVFISRA